MAFKQITESESHYRHLEKMPVAEILANMNAEDKTVPAAIEKSDTADRTTGSCDCG